MVLLHFASSLHFPLSLTFLTEELQTVLFRSRNIDGQVLRSFNTHSGSTALVPSLGPVADAVVDGLGFPTPTISLLHTVYINAHRSINKRRKWFLKAMANHGMSLMEAAMFWSIIDVPLSNKFYYRVRIDINIE